MSVPLRKDPPDEELATADLAHSSPALEDRRPKPVLAQPQGTDVADAAPDVGNAATAIPLFPNHEIADLRSRWNDVQTAFVDEPRRAVEQADGSSPLR